MATDHVIVTPCLASIESETKQINMQPDVAVWMAGANSPLNWPKRMPVSDSPSYTET